MLTVIRSIDDRLTFDETGARTQWLGRNIDGVDSTHNTAHISKERVHELVTQGHEVVCFMSKNANGAVMADFHIVVGA